MSRTDQNPDASMEEILASIRRIISEDAGDDLTDARPRRDRQPAPRPVSGNAFASELARALDEQADDDDLVEAEDDDILDLDRTPAAGPAPVAAPRLDAVRPQRPAPVAATRPALADPPPLARRTPAPQAAAPALRPVAPPPRAAPAAKTETGATVRAQQAVQSLRARTAEITAPRPAAPLAAPLPLTVPRPVAAKAAPVAPPPMVARAAPPVAAPAPAAEADAADDELELTAAPAAAQTLNGSEADGAEAYDEAGGTDEVISLDALGSAGVAEDEPELTTAAAQRIVAEEVAPVAGTPANAVLAPVAAAQAIAGPGIGAMLLPVRSLEDTVADLLKPMLREWLDANMPRIIAKALTPDDIGKSLGGRKGA